MWDIIADSLGPSKFHVVVLVIITLDTWKSKLDENIACMNVESSGLIHLGNQ